MELKRETIGGIECAIEVDGYGRFSVTPITDGEERNSEVASFCTTMDAALAQAKAALAKRKVRLDIPFITAAGERGIATGRHSGTGYVLARIDGAAVQLSGYQDRLVFPGDVDPEVIERYRKAEADRRDAEKRLAQIKSDEMIEIDKVVDEAIDAHVRETDEAQLAGAVDDPRGAADR